MMSYNFAEEFSKFPGPRTEDIGPNSGKKFREEVLQNWFDNNIEVEIDVSGTVMSFGPSFMSEAFGKMAKEYGKEKFYDIIHVKEEGSRNKKLQKLLEKHVDIELSK